MTIFGASSLHPKIPFPAPVVEREVGPHCTRNSNFWAAVIRDLRPGLQLFRIESERLKLPAPFNRRIAEPFDADAAGMAHGEGGGLLILEELEHAKSRGAKIYAELVGFGASQDTYSVTEPDPSGHSYGRTAPAA